jgi:hypothetical protein
MHWWPRSHPRTHLLAQSRSDENYETKIAEININNPNPEKHYLLVDAHGPFRIEITKCGEDGGVVLKYRTWETVADNITWDDWKELCAAHTGVADFPLQEEYYHQGGDVTIADREYLLIGCSLERYRRVSEHCRTIRDALVRLPRRLRVQIMAAGQFSFGDHLIASPKAGDQWSWVDGKGRQNNCVGNDRFHIGGLANYVLLLEQRFDIEINRLKGIPDYVEARKSFCGLRETQGADEQIL